MWLRISNRRNKLTIGYPAVCSVSQSEATLNESDSTITWSIAADCFPPLLTVCTVESVCVDKTYPNATVGELPISSVE